MIWTLIIGFLAFMLIKFFLDYNKDKDDLQDQSFDKKFSITVRMINDAAFNGSGEITTLTTREFNLYKEGENQLIKFQYSTGILTITWKYKYYQKEIVHSKQFSDARNLSVFQQQRLAEQMINEMNVVVERHKAEVIRDI